MLRDLISGRKSISVRSNSNGFTIEARDKGPVIYYEDIMLKTILNFLDNYYQGDEYLKLPVGKIQHDFNKSKYYTNIVTEFSMMFGESRKRFDDLLLEMIRRPKKEIQRLLRR